MQIERKGGQGARIYISKIDGIENATVSQKNALQHFASQKLLKYAYERQFGLHFDELTPRKLENGKWVCDKGFFSISHSGKLVAVTLADFPVGLDLQAQTSAKSKTLLAIAKKFFTADELANFNASPDKIDEFFFTWCKKEALWKMLDDQPQTICPVETANRRFFTWKFDFMGQTYYLVCTDCNAVVDCEKLNIE